MQDSGAKVQESHKLNTVTVHPWYQWAKFLFWYFIYHDIIVLVSYAYTTEANLICCFIVWIFGLIGFNVNGLFGQKSNCKKKRRKNKRKRRKPQECYSENDELDQEEYDDQNQSQQVQEEETYQQDTNADQTKCDDLLKNLLALVPGMMAGQASHYEKLVEQFKGTASQ